MAKMGLWLFHRKSHKRSRSGANLSDPDTTGDANAAGFPPRSQTFDPSQSLPKRQKTTRREPNKLRRRNYSYSPGRPDSIRVTRNPNERRLSPQRTPSSFYHYPHQEHQQRTSPDRPPLSHQNTEPTYYTRQQRSPGDPASRDGSYEWDRVPTLRSRTKSTKSGKIKRTKSSKRRKVDREREAEIKAMTAMPEPIRPATDAWMAGRPMTREFRRVKTTGGVFSPYSDISLPSAESTRSNFSTDSEQAAYGVSVLESLAPRPTLRYSSLPAHLTHHRHAPGEYLPFGEDQGQGAAPGTGPWRTRSQKRKLADRPPIPEATLRAHKRIDDLADDFSASEIRELMERDKRRRERRKQKEQERVERRLARQAEVEMDMARRYEEHGRSSPPNLERGVLGRELAELGVSQPASAVVTSSRPRTPTEVTTHAEDGPRSRSPSDRVSTSSSQPRPLEYFHRPESIHMADDDNDRHRSHLPTPPHEDSDLDSPLPFTRRRPEERAPSSFDEHAPIHSRTDVETTAQSSSVGAAAIAATDLPQRKSSINRRKSDRRVLTKKSRSKSPPLAHQTQGVSSPVGHDDNSTTQKSFETGASGRASRLSWTAIFKWPGRRKRSLAEPVSFTNPSRDSMQGAPSASAAHAPPTGDRAAVISTSATQPHPGSVPIAPNVTFIRPSQDGSPYVPRRTFSRFREDLPETPISPPDSRFPLPDSEQAAVRPAPVSIPGEDLEPEHMSQAPTPTQDSHGSPYRERDVDRASPISIPLSSVNPSPEPHSISMASIDSEGSWFGGGRRRNHIASLSRYQQHEPTRHQRTASAQSQVNNTDDEFGLGDDEYFSRLSPPPPAHNPGAPTGEPRPSSDGGHEATDGEATWGTISTPTVVHRQAPRMKSSEGLLNTYEADADIRMDEKEDSGVDTESDSPIETDEVAGVHRATSINLGRGHVRHVSAGSAKLLELSPRPSGEVKRRSIEPPAAITQ